MSTYDLFNRPEYFDHITERFKNASAGDTIILATMEYRPDQQIIADIVDALCIASRNGAHVTFLVDAFSFMLKEGSVLGPMYFRKKDPKSGYGPFKQVVQSVHTLRDNGVTCEVINKPVRALRNPFGGRSHIKFAVINDEVFVGGCNLSHPEQLDVMVRTYNQGLAEYLIDFSNDVIKHKNVRLAMKNRDAHYKIDETTDLYIDSGVRRQSLIYDKAFELINGATKRVYMTCQYFPNNSTPAALANAHDRGVMVHLAYNHPRQHNSAIRNAQTRTIAYKKKRLPESVFANQLDMDRNYLHAKILLSEKEAIIGSHNFVELGVSLGTAEIALKSTSPTFIESAREWITEL